ncbi:hypothetical protein M0813_00818 [Anaeramoeba flamelloides]|uniref:ER membrane protein complex subunit 1 n=1 Tax=Anaeramoeba flamelloides TaxID=1746091 RepID=A0ABQ8XH31_9EUKA|nr:hypothetical protein M0813_00818 [Anaeramoeba flamelloides]
MKILFTLALLLIFFQASFCISTEQTKKRVHEGIGEIVRSDLECGSSSGIFVQTESNMVALLKPKNGEIVWKHKFNEKEKLITSTCSHHSSVVLTDRKILVVQPNTGKVLNEFNHNFNTITFSKLRTGKDHFVVVLDDTIQYRELKTGNIKYSTKYSKKEFELASLLLNEESNSVVVVGINKKRKTPEFLYLEEQKQKEKGKPKGTDKEKKVNQEPKLIKFQVDSDNKIKLNTKPTLLRKQSIVLYLDQERTKSVNFLDLNSIISQGKTSKDNNVIITVESLPLKNLKSGNENLQIITSSSSHFVVVQEQYGQGLTKSKAFIYKFKKSNKKNSIILIAEKEYNNNKSKNKKEKGNGKETESTFWFSNQRSDSDFVTCVQQTETKLIITSYSSEKTINEEIDYFKRNDYGKIKNVDLLFFNLNSKKQILPFYLIEFEDLSLHMVNINQKTTKTKNILWGREEALTDIIDLLIIPKKTLNIYQNSNENNKFDLEKIKQSLQIKIDESKKKMTSFYDKIPKSTDEIKKHFNLATNEIKQTIYSIINPSEYSKQPGFKMDVKKLNYVKKNWHLKFEDSNSQKFDFNKLLVIITRNGNVYGFSTSENQIIWKIRLPISEKSGSLDQIFRINDKQIFIIGSSNNADLDGNNKQSKSTFIAMIDIVNKEIIESKWFEQWTAKQAISIGLKDDGDDDGDDNGNKIIRPRKVVLILDNQGDYHLFPKTEYVLKSFDLIYNQVHFVVMNKETNTLLCYHFIKDDLFKTTDNPPKPEIKWTKQFDKKEEVTQININDESQYPDKHLNNNYYNPYMISLLTYNKEEKTITVLIIDTVSGKIIGNVKNYDASLPATIQHYANKLVYHYWGTKVKTTVMSVIELKANAFSSKHYRQNKKNILYQNRPMVTLKKQSYLFPSYVNVMGVSKSKDNVNQKGLVLALSTGDLFLLSDSFLNPERTLNVQNAMKLGLMPYTTYLPHQAKNIINDNEPVLQVKDIKSDHTEIESTSFIVAYGLDLFYDCVTIDQSFDKIDSQFNFSALIITMLVLIIALIAMQRMKGNKNVKTNWN